MGDSQGVVVIEDGEEVVRVDAGTWRVRNEEIALARRRKRVDIQVTFTLVVWPRCWNTNQYRKDDRPARGSLPCTTITRR